MRLTQLTWFCNISPGSYPVPQHVGGACGRPHTYMSGCAPLQSVEVILHCDVFDWSSLLTGSAVPFPLSRAVLPCTGCLHAVERPGAWEFGSLWHVKCYFLPGSYAFIIYFV